MVKPLLVTILTLFAVMALRTASFGPQRTSPVAVGEEAPGFALEDQNGQKVTLAAARGKSPVVVVFYRGYW